MNGNFYNFDHIVIETPGEREQKKRRQRSLFSRVFFALFLYVLISQGMQIAVYLTMQTVLDPAKYLEFKNNTVLALLIGCAAQYLIAFPIFLLALIGTKKAEAKEKSKLSLRSFVLLFCIGQVLMYAGNAIGTFINELVGTFTGHLPENEVESLITDTPLWIVIPVVVIIAPIVEEIICRKLIIDRLSVYGDHVAIIFSSVAFGLLHGNLYQFFYAALLGAVLGYVYTKTRNVKYSIFMHMIVNFMGSVVALPVQDAMTEMAEILEIMQTGEAINLLKLLASTLIVLLYSGLQYGIIIGGIVAAVHCIKNREIKISTDKEVYLPNKDIAVCGTLNVGAILFLVATLTIVVLNLILV